MDSNTNKRKSDLFTKVLESTTKHLKKKVLKIFKSTSTKYLNPRLIFSAYFMLDIDQS